jgi:hypothetical protein
VNILHHVGRLLVLGSVAVLALTLPLALASAADGQGEIDSSGPLTRIIISRDLNCQVAHQADELLEFYDPTSDVGACGTFLAVNGTLYSPAEVPSGITGTPWTPVTQSGVSGNGTSGDPYRIVTVVTTPDAGVRIEQTDSYVVGTQSYRTDVTVDNMGNASLSGVLYRYGDCYLQGADSGFSRVDGSAPACVTGYAASDRIEQWLPLTSGNQWFAGGYSEGWSDVATGEPLPNTCQCSETETFDNGAGISWTLNLGPGASATFSHQTFFSPTGGSPAAASSFRSSVPDPTQVTLDPVVVAESAVVAAGVMVLVPFPSSLFNSTLEDNYDEVMALIARLRVWLLSLGASLVAWLRRQIAARRSAGSAPAPPVAQPTPSQPAMAQTPTTAQAPTTVEAPVPQAEHRDRWRSPLGILGFVCVSALLYAFLDPTFGVSLESLGELIGLAIGLLVILVAYGVPLILFSIRHSIGLTIRALPATLAVAVTCVLVSRLADFQPGYLYGLIVGFYFAHEVSHEVEGKAEAVAAGTSLVAAALAWVLLVIVRSGMGPGDAFGTVLVESATVTVVVAGVENAVFEMLPLRFLPGAAVYEWDKRVWAVLIGLGVFAFAHVLLNPAAGAGYLADTTRTSFFTMIALLVAFAVASVVFWAWFRFRPSAEPVGPEGPESHPGL